MRQFVIAVFLLAFASAFIALVSYPHDAPATAAESNDAPLDSNAQFTQVKPAPGSGTGTDNGVYLPPVAGSHSEITGTVQSQDEPAGPQRLHRRQRRPTRPQEILARPHRRQRPLPLRRTGRDYGSCRARRVPALQ